MAKPTLALRKCGETSKTFKLLEAAGNTPQAINRCLSYIQWTEIESVKTLATTLTKLGTEMKNKIEKLPPSYDLDTGEIVKDEDGGAILDKDGKEQPVIKKYPLRKMMIKFHDASMEILLETYMSKSIQSQVSWDENVAKSGLKKPTKIGDKLVVVQKLGKSIDF